MPNIGGKQLSHEGMNPNNLGKTQGAIGREILAKGCSENKGTRISDL